MRNPTPILMTILLAAGATSAQPNRTAVDINKAFADPTQWRAEADPVDQVSFEAETQRVRDAKAGVCIIYQEVRPDPAKHGGRMPDNRWLVSTVRVADLGEPFDHLEQYNRVSVWVYVTGPRHAVGGLIARTDGGWRQDNYARRPIPVGQWCKLTLNMHHRPPEQRARITRIGFFRLNQLPEPGDTARQMKVYLSGWRLENVPQRKPFGTAADPSVLVVNQLGYAPAGRKMGVLNGGVSATTFSVRDSATDQVVYRGAFEWLQNAAGVFKLADFSELTAPGRYYLKADLDGPRSVRFGIAGGLSVAATDAVLHWVRGQRCGVKTQRHDACHLDDGVLIKLDGTREHVDLSGGYHDAGDFAQYWDRPGIVASGAAEVWRARQRAGANATPAMEEWAWAVGSIEKFVDVLGPELSYRYGWPGRRNYWTDNVVGNGDDRVFRQIEGRGLDLTRGLLTAWTAARLAGVTQEDATRNQAIAFARTMLGRERRHVPGAARAFEVLTCIALHRATGEKKWRDKAEAGGRQLLELQERGFLGGSRPGLSGLFYSTPNGFTLQGWDNQRFHMPQVWAVAQLALAYPDSEHWHAWHFALRRFSEFWTKPLAAYEQPWGEPVGRLEYWSRAVQLHGDYRGFATWADAIPLGTNAVRKELMFGIIGDKTEEYTPDRTANPGYNRQQVAEVLGDLELEHLARRQAGWFFGENAFNAMSVTGFGDDPIEDYYGLVGPQPGALVAAQVTRGAMVRNGLQRGLIKEVWIVAGGAYLRLLGRLEAPAGVEVKVRDDGKPWSGTVRIVRLADGKRLAEGDAREGVFRRTMIPGGARCELRIGAFRKPIDVVSGADYALAVDLATSASIRLAGAAAAVEDGAKPRSYPAGQTVVTQTGKPCRITLEVASLGSADSTHTVRFIGDNAAADAQARTVSVPAGKTERVTFAVTPAGKNQPFIARFELDGSRLDAVDVCGEAR